MLPSAPSKLRASDVAYERLKKMIVNLSLDPGSVVNEAKLMQDMHMGRTPLREAIHRLAMEKLLVILPRRGTYVANLSVQDLQQIFEVRLPLEGLCARLAAERITEKELAEMQSVIARMEKVIERNDYQALITLDQTFHRRMAQATRNELLVEILERLNNQSLRFWYMSFSLVGRLQEILAEHETIIRALSARDAAAAEAVTREHISSFKQKVLSTL